MNIVRLIAAVAMLTTVAILSVSAQQPKTGAAAPPAAQTSNVAVPHTEQTGRTTASECAVAGSKTITAAISSSSTFTPSEYERPI